MFVKKGKRGVEEVDERGRKWLRERFFWWVGKLLLLLGNITQRRGL